MIVRIPRTNLPTATLVIALALLIVGFYSTKILVVSLLVALFASTIALPIADCLDRFGLPRSLGALIAVSIVMMVCGAAVAYVIVDVIPQIIEALRQVIDEHGSSFSNEALNAQSFLNTLNANSVLVLLNDNCISVEKREECVGISRVILSTSTDVVGGLFLSFFLVFYFVKDRDYFVRVLIALIPFTRIRASLSLIKQIWRVIAGYVRGTLIAATFDAFFIGCGLYLLGIPNWAPLSLLIFFGAFVPFVGAAFTGLIAAFIALGAGSVKMAICTLCIVTFVQLFEALVIYPNVMQKAVSLHPVTILCALTIGTSVFGTVGALSAVPLAAVVVVVVESQNTA